MAAYTENLASFDLKGLYQSGALKQRPGMLLARLLLSSLLAAILQPVLPKSRDILFATPSCVFLNACNSRRCISFQYKLCTSGLGSASMYLDL